MSGGIYRAETMLQWRAPIVTDAEAHGRDRSIGGKAAAQLKKLLPARRGKDTEDGALQ